MGHHGALVQPRFAAILDRPVYPRHYCGLLILAFRSHRVSGRRRHALARDPQRPPRSRAPRQEHRGRPHCCPEQAVTGTGTTPTLTPTVTPTEYLERDATGPVDAPSPSPSPPTTSPTTAAPTSVPSAGVETARSTTQAATPALPDATARATDRTEMAPVSASEPASVVAHLGVQGGVDSPSSITVPAGAEVTLVFENQDEGVPHNVVVYAENAAPSSSARSSRVRPAPRIPLPPRRRRAGTRWGAASRNYTGRGPSSSSRDAREARGPPRSWHRAADSVPLPEAIRGGRLVPVLGPTRWRSIRSRGRAAGVRSPSVWL